MLTADQLLKSLGSIIEMIPAGNTQYALAIARLANAIGQQGVGEAEPSVSIRADHTRATAALSALDDLAIAMGIDPSMYDSGDLVAELRATVATLRDEAAAQAEALDEVRRAAGLDEVLPLSALVGLLCDRLRKVRKATVAVAKDDPRRGKPDRPLLVGEITLRHDGRSVTLVERDTGGGIDLAAVAAHGRAIMALMRPDA